MLDSAPVWLVLQVAAVDQLDLVLHSLELARSPPARRSVGEEEVAPRAEVEAAMLVAAKLPAAKALEGQGAEGCQWGCQTRRRLQCESPDSLQLWDCWRKHSAPQLEG